MSLKATIQNIERLKKELDALLPLKKEDEERLWKKFRLEWSYNSNHIEGNTLTYGETELLLIFGKTTGDHTLREYEEMKAHDAAVSWLKDLAVEPDDRMSETFIRQLNEVILKEPYYKPGETMEGAPAPKQIIPGHYKTTRNSVRLATGEMFHYASPEETPAKMGDLVQWYRQATANSQLHPVQVAAELHYKFVLIHPFDDGNGRVARLLMNYALMRAGYPPIIIPTKDKKAYLDALNKVDTKVDTDAFAGYIAKQLVWSMELNLKAAKCEDIEEDDDLDKEIEVLSRKVKPNLQVSLTDNLVWELYELFHKELFDEFIRKHAAFNKLSSNNRLYFTINGHEFKSVVEFEKALINYSDFFETQRRKSEDKKTAFVNGGVGFLVPLKKYIGAIGVGFIFDIVLGKRGFNNAFFFTLDLEFEDAGYKIFAGKKVIWDLTYKSILTSSQIKTEMKKVAKSNFEAISKHLDT